jgi:hypothetical protein
MDIIDRFGGRYIVGVGEGGDGEWGCIRIVEEKIEVLAYGMVNSTK